MTRPRLVKYNRIAELSAEDAQNKVSGAGIGRKDLQMDITKRFMQYVQYNTQSAERGESFPSTESQVAFGKILAEDLRAIGVQDVQQDGYGYVTGTIPATTDRKLPVVGFLAHMDTAPDFTAEGVKPRLLDPYEGGDIVLNEAEQIVTRVEDFPSLADKAGKRLIVTDGTTLLGGDDKAGICIIFAMAEHLINHPEIPHGKIRIAFTPDEEIGSGVDHFDVEAFGADYAYTIDGGGLGGIEYETFNAASAKVEVQGKSSHPGSGKGHMKHAAEIAMDFHNMLPAQEKAQYTEGYEGFIHLLYIGGSVEHTEMYYIVRDHDRALFEEKKALMQKAADFINEKYGADTLALTVTDSYYNMREKIEPHKEIVEQVCTVMREMGIEPQIEAVRGGTDGSRLSFMGLPCPNLFTGSYEFHGRYEYVCVDEMEACAELLVRLVTYIGKEQ